MDALKNWKTQATSILVAAFAVFNSIYPDALDAETETKIIAGLVALIGVFLTLKINRKTAGGDR